MYYPTLAMVEFFGQQFEAHDLAVVALLIVLEGVLSIDNALVLGLLAKRLPKHQQSKALTYGLVGAFIFRLIAISTVMYLMHWRVVKLLGGAYLIYVAVKHFFFERHEPHRETVKVGADGHPVITDEGVPLPEEAEEREVAQRTPVPAPRRTQPDSIPLRKVAKFWPTVLVIELTDIAFAVDSILAAMAMVKIPANMTGVPPKLWVVVTGGMLGVILMRFAAIVFIRLLERFPRFEVSAYLLIIVIGLKLVADWHFNAPPAGWAGGEFHGPLDFHSPHSPAFWVFWGLMLGCFALGFIPKKPTHPTEPPKPQQA